MNTKKIVFTIFKTCITFAIIMLICFGVYKLCVKSYDFGFRIFAEEAMSPPPGLTVSVAIVEGKSVMEIGQILEEKGLIRSAYLFYLQEMVSSYHDQLKPGVYEFSTAMTANEIMALMAAEPDESEGSGETNGNSDSVDVYGDGSVSDDSIYDDGSFTDDDDTSYTDDSMFLDTED